MTIITVHSTVTAIESEYELTSTGLEMLGGIGCGVTAKPKKVIPSAEGVDQPLFSKSHRVPIEPRLRIRGAVIAIQLLLHMIQHLQTFKSKAISSVDRE